MEEHEEETTLLAPDKKSSSRKRNLVGFWIIGLTNNFAYTVMLSSAHDILTPINTTNATGVENRTGHLIKHCNPIGTGAILLADILPALIIKLMAPLLLQKLPYVIRVCSVMLFSASSFILVSAGGNKNIAVSIVGVVCASAAAGLGETTYLGLMSHFDKDVVSTWSSGTGAAGLIATVSYAGITSLGVHPSTVLLSMIVVPIIMAVSYFVILVHPSPGLLTSASIEHHYRHHYRTFSVSRRKKKPVAPDKEDAVADASDSSREVKASDDTSDDSDEVVVVVKGRSFLEKLKVIKPLLRYMIPLFYVYLLEYFINQALYELLLFDNSWMNISEQYRWYLAIYQIGVFMSRSSVSIVHIPFTWIFPILQLIVCILLICQVFFHYIPYILIVFLIVLFEGLFSGAAYVNTFYAILSKIEKQDQELATSLTCTSDSLGITIAALIATPVHNVFCGL